MNELKQTPLHYVDTSAGLHELVEQLATQPLIAVDTESNSLYAYRSRVCLIQLSTRQADYIIDPLAVDHMQSFGELLADAAIEKIFHAAEYDLIGLKRDFGFEVHNLFDTMYAARMCGFTSVGLANLLEEFFNVQIDKSHQRDDWGMRPLPEDSLQYARMDTHYLPRLRDMLHERLAQQGQLEEAREVFADVLRISVRSRDFDPEGFWKIGRPHSLTRRQMAILREVYLLREQLAQEEDLPPFKIYSNNAMVDIAKSRPTSLSQLGRIRSISGKQIRLYGQDLLEAVERGRSNRLPTPPPAPQRDPAVAERYTVLHAWRKERAQERGIESNMVVSKQTLWQLAHQLPADMEALHDIDGLGDWRLRHYGDELLDLIASLREQNGDKS